MTKKMQKQVSTGEEPAVFALKSGVRAVSATLTWCCWWPGHTSEEEE